VGGARASQVPASLADHGLLARKGDQPAVRVPQLACTCSRTETYLKGAKNLLKGTKNSLKGTKNLLKGTKNFLKGTKGTEKSSKGYEWYSRIKGTEKSSKGYEWYSRIKGTEKSSKGYEWYSRYLVRVRRDLRRGSGTEAFASLGAAAACRRDRTARPYCSQYYSTVPLAQENRALSKQAR
jgi:hypothetical protein